METLKHIAFFGWLLAGSILVTILIAAPLAVGYSEIISWIIEGGSTK